MTIYISADLTSFWNCASVTIASDKSPADVSDTIKDALYSKAAERINSQRQDIAASMFDPSIADTEVSDETIDDSAEEES